jgi:hypothetical protein
MYMRWFSPGTPVFSTNKTDHHDITEILLKEELYKPLNFVEISKNSIIINKIADNSQNSRNQW